MTWLERNLIGFVHFVVTPINHDQTNPVKPNPAKLDPVKLDPVKLDPVKPNMPEAVSSIEIAQQHAALPPDSAHSGDARSEPGELITLRTLRRMARQGQPFAALTCYDATFARLLERAGVHVLLVGDTAAEVVLGFHRTIDMPLEISLALTAAVKRGAPNTVVMGDMPFMSYQLDINEAVRNAGRFLTDGHADIVKLEVDSSFKLTVAAMARAGIPVCAHIGSLPQRAAIAGGYGSAGRTRADAAKIVDDAVAMEEAGAAMLLIEAVPDEVTKAVMHTTKLPLIGIGAGPNPHGQVLVLHDLLGLTPKAPRFADPVAMLGLAVENAGREWVKRVLSRNVGGQHYTMREE